MIEEGVYIKVLFDDTIKKHYYKYDEITIEEIKKRNNVNCNHIKIEYAEGGFGCDRITILDDNDLKHAIKDINDSKESDHIYPTLNMYMKIDHDEKYKEYINNGINILKNEIDYKEIWRDSKPYISFFIMTLIMVYCIYTYNMSIIMWFPVYYLLSIFMCALAIVYVSLFGMLHQFFFGTQAIVVM